MRSWHSIPGLVRYPPYFCDLPAHSVLWWSFTSKKWTDLIARHETIYFRTRRIDKSSRITRFSWSNSCSHSYFRYFEDRSPPPSPNPNFEIIPKNLKGNLGSMGKDRSLGVCTRHIPDCWILAETWEEFGDFRFCFRKFRLTTTPSKNMLVRVYSKTNKTPRFCLESEINKFHLRWSRECHKIWTTNFAGLYAWAKLSLSPQRGIFEEQPI